MIALDTNILVRFLTRDDPAQHRAVMRLLGKTGEAFFIANHVILELHWVLERRYQWARADIAGALLALLAVQNAAFEDEAALRQAVASYSSGGDLADELICGAARKHGCASIATFDTGLLRAHPAYAFEPR